MPSPFLEITYRLGKPFAAYLYLNRHNGEKSVRTERHADWLIDFAADGRVIGIEFTRIGMVDLAALNRLLAERNQPELSMADLVPLSAA